MGTLVDAELARRGHPPIMKIEGVLTTGKPQKIRRDRRGPDHPGARDASRYAAVRAGDGG
ncbi:MAG: hypothetical protein JO166_12790 [Deltaproteobacteria bacterium]|nr:hypothetical protein [Deltaproteobacteria bacterium]